MFYSKTTGGFYTPEIHGNNIPSDAVEINDNEHAALLSGQSSGKVISADASGRPFLADPAGPTVEQVYAQYSAAAQGQLEAVAHDWGYDSVISIASYSASTVPQFKADAEAFIAWRDAYWLAANAIKVSVKNGAAKPATAAAFVALLPAPPAKPVV